MGKALMETKQFKISSTNDEAQRLSVPPGFVSLTSFTLRKVVNSEETCRSAPVGSNFEPDHAVMDTSRDIVNISKLKNSLGQRPWILHDHFNRNLGESDPVPLDTVLTRWRPGEACSIVLEEVPVFSPTEEEFKDTVKYVARIRPEVEPYGICRIIPPPSWKPPCPFVEKKQWETSTFTTLVQPIDELQTLYSKKKLVQLHEKMNGKRKMTSGTNLKHGSADECGTCPDISGDYTRVFDFECGPAFTRKTFKKYADDFKKQYFHKENKMTDSNANSSEPSLEKIEDEYWRIVENPSDSIEVLCGAKLDSRSFGSGFPVVSKSVKTSEYLKTPEYIRYVDSGWNLNVLPKLPGSLLAFENPKSDVLYPQLDIGMCFSSHCWRVEEHHLYSLCYTHLGAPKIWYGVPGRYSIKFEAVLKKYFPDFFVEHPGLLHNLVAQLSPLTLKSAGIPVYRCVQYARELVLTLPGAYHSEINCGFNCSESAKYAPLDWLPHGLNAVQIYSDQSRKTSISHDKLLLCSAVEAVRALWEISLLKKNTKGNLRWKEVCGIDGILTKTLKTRVKQERLRREYFCTSSQARVMEENFDATDKRECRVCYNDLYLSATGCPSCSNIYSCLRHAKKLCSCSWTDRCFLYRYEISDLNVLVEALEGNFGAVYRWAKRYFGLTLHSIGSR